jgi:hypothetical protein
MHYQSYEVMWLERQILFAALTILFFWGGGGHLTILPFIVAFFHFDSDLYWILHKYFIQGKLYESTLRMDIVH